MANMKADYEKTVRRYARQVVGTDIQISHYILEDISTRYEKQILKELIRKTERTIKDNKEFDLPYEIEEKMLETYNNRKKSCQ